MAYTYNMSMTQLKIQDGDLTFESICSLTDVCTWNLRPGMNSAANFTPSVNFSEFKLVSFMAYTYTELDLVCRKCVARHVTSLWNTVYSSCIPK